MWTELLGGKVNESAMVIGDVFVSTSNDLNEDTVDFFRFSRTGWWMK